MVSGKIQLPARIADPPWPVKQRAAPATTAGHKERAHSKYSASGAERWFMCPGSVALSEGLPDKDSIWSKEGTLAHEVLEAMMLELLGRPMTADQERVLAMASPAMFMHARHAARFILTMARGIRHAEVMVETRIYLDFIDPAMFGTFDGAIVDYFGTLHVFDYKYGAGHAVSVRENLQMIFYGLGLAHRFDWNFKAARLWIIQPRIKGYDGPTFWEMPIRRLKAYVPRFREARDRVVNEPDKFVEGSWCHFCKAKGICPLKRAAKLEKMQLLFADNIERV